MLRLLLAGVLSLTACASFQHQPLESVPYQQHAVTQSDKDLQVSISVLSNEESQQASGVDLKVKWMQALWIRVYNGTDKPYWVLYPSMDPNYFSPDEVAYAYCGAMAESATLEMEEYLFGRRYRYSPVSPLYLFNRKQDVALQKARGSVHARNHLRLWLTPLTYRGKEVWVGQISRDIGVRFTTRSKNWVTHKIDPDVDEARNLLIQEMLFSAGLVKVGLVRGVGESPPENPSQNLTGDPYFTDGLRAVLMMDHRNTPIKEVKFFHWHYPSHKARVLSDTGGKALPKPGTPAPTSPR